jgi:carboxyl-terminal processing protease
MKRLKLSPRTRALALAPLIALGLALAINLFLRRIEVRRDPALTGAPADQGPLEPSQSKRSPEKLSDSLLTDSILSIVQSYYVDQERVDNKGLLVTALASLSASPRVHSGADEFGVWVEIDDTRKSFALSDEPRYQDVLEVFSEIGALLDEAGVTVTLGEAQDKHAAGSVMLLNAMLAELDAHSALLSPDAYKELRQGTEGSFGGLGVLVGIRDNQLTVIKPLPRSPAQRAGIRKHDRILGIDGVFTYGYSLDELVEYMRGDPGTDVQLSLLREGSVSPSELTLKREVIHVDSVTAKDLEKDGAKILHLTVESFSSRTSREVLSAIKKARQRNGGVLSGLVLDLRANPGGLLDQAVQVADLFLQQGIIVTTKGRREEVESAGSGFDEVGFPVVVLIDGDSASASEIVAGALQDHGRALVIGQPSFGKGSVQTIFELPGERALKLTIARYYTPAGRSIQNVGIIPDVWLQPVFRAERNENLFGAFRYKNERFLRNHLEDASGQPRDANLRWPARKAYYVADPLDEQDQERGPVDREMEMALSIIARLHDVYGERLPEEAQRSTHWLGMAGPVISKKVAELDAESRAHLLQKFAVPWSEPGMPVYNANVDLQLESGEWGEVLPGQTLALKWRIHNREERPVERVSVYVRSEMPGFETKEILVGGLPAKGDKRGTLEVQVPPSWEPGPLVLRVGVAVDAWPAKSGAADVPVQVRARPVAVLEAAVELIEESGGRSEGVLEGQEKAKLRVTLRNVGDADASELTAKLINLSGEQVKIENDGVKVSSLAAGATNEARFSVRASKTLLSDELAFGLLVEAGELRSPLRQRFTIKSRGSGELSSKSPGVMSH